LTNVTNNDERDTERPAPAPVATPEQRQVPPATQAKPAEKREHTLLEIAIGFIGLLAFFAAAWQAYVANDTEKRSLRAYVILSHNFKKIDGFGSGKTPYIVAMFENLGQTPVYSATWQSGIDFLPYPLKIEIVYPDCAAIMRTPDAKRWTFGKSTDIDKRGIRAMADVGNDARAITDIEWQQYTEGTAAFYFVGRFCYKDIFEKIRHTDFCTQYRKGSDGLEFCERNNDAD